MPRLSHRAITDRLLARVFEPVLRETREGLQGARSHTDNRSGSIEARLDAIEATIRELSETRIAEAERRIQGVADHLPFLLDRLSTTNALSRDARRRLEEVERSVGGVGEMSARLQRVEDRTEFVRREFMHELRYGAGRPGEIGHVDVRIVDETGLVITDGLVAGSHEGPLRVNVGAGHIPLDGYLNVDARALDGIDIVADVHALPFTDASVDEIAAAHLAEHFPEQELRRRLLPHWIALLRPGGVLRLIVPDAEAMLGEHGAGRYSFDDLRLVTFGEQEYDGDFHFNMFSRSGLRDILVHAGLVEVTLVAHSRRNGASYEMEYVAMKPFAASTKAEAEVAARGDAAEADRAQ